MSKVLNGDTIEQLQAYVEKHFIALEQIVKAVKETQESEEYERLKGSIVLDGTGSGQAILSVPQGYDYVLQRITVTSTVAGTCDIYENSVSPTELLEHIANSQLYSDAFSNDIYVPAGSSVVVNFTGGGAGGTATYNLQIKRNKRRAHTHNPVKGNWWGNS